MPKKIIMDVDTGSDDAVALMAAILSPDIDLVAICTVAGNKPIEMTTENTLRVVEAMKADVPVYKGGPQPLLKTLIPNRLEPTHRKTAEKDGKQVQMHEDYLDLPPTTLQPQDMPAAAFYVDYLRKAKEPITIVAVGPLTNLAVALLMDPSIVEKIDQLVIMGGGCRVANSTSCAEFNIWFDPEAAQWVQRSGANILWVPLDATHAAYLTRQDCEKFRSLGNLAGNFAADLIEQRIFVHNSAQPLAVPDAAAVHDALALCAVLDPTVLKDVQHVHCDIGIGDYAEGQTIIDSRFYPEERNCWFAFDGDPEKFSTMLYDLFKKQ